jgi:hypothetical protein
MKKWELSRRTMLRGFGTLLALPVLDAMMPSIARAQAAGTAPKRLVAFYAACGIRMQAWTPAATGVNWALTPILNPLGAFNGLPSVKDDVLILTGLANRPAQPDGPGDHASGTGAFLTAAHPFKTNASNIRNGISMDQVAAGALKQFTRFPSLELGNNSGGNSGDCDSGYSCAYANNISWASATQPLAKETNPQSVFDRLFGAVDPNQTQAAVAKRKKYKQSVLDAVKDDAASLKARLGTTDKRKIEEFSTGLRELEVRIQSEQPTACQPSARPPGGPDLRAKTTQMLDLIAFAFQCDLTRVATFMLQNAGSNFVYDFLGITDGHHELSHHGGNAAKLSALEKIDAWEVEQFAYLLRKLKSIPEAGGTVLDNSLAFFSSEIEDGDSHSHFNMPIIVGGRAGGNFTPGRHLRYTNSPSVGNLFATMLNATGVPSTSFGDSTGLLTDVKV